MPNPSQLAPFKFTSVTLPGIGLPAPHPTLQPGEGAASGGLARPFEAPPPTGGAVGVGCSVCQVAAEGGCHSSLIQLLRLAI